MKQFLFSTIVLLFLVVNIVSSEMSPEESEKFFTYIQICKNETGATEADVGDLYNRVLPTTKPAKCLNACVFDKIEIMVDGKFVPANLIKVVEMEKSELKGKDGKNLMDSMNDFIAECKDIADPDKCEFASKIRVCLNAAAKKHEFCPNVF